MEPTEVVLEHQDIQCKGDDSQSSFPVFGNNVLVKASELNTTDNNTASNKIKVSQISKFEWEEKYYSGNLVSCNSTYIAYVLKAKGSADDHVRVINHHTSSRVLLRGFKKCVEDVNFESFKSNQLACVDSEGTLFVFDIFETEGNVKSKIIIKVVRSHIDTAKTRRVVWAPNLLLPMEGHEPMVALSSGCEAEVFNIHTIKENFKEAEELSRDDIMKGVIRIEKGHTEEITSLALSPDTQVLATCSLDGDVKFWSLNFEAEDPPTCLHEWEPHDGEPVSCLFFCDNLVVSDDSSPFWRYLITGTARNSVLKIWCAVKWECMQTLRFDEYADSAITSPCFKVALDISAKYLILSDIHRQVLYICQMHHDLEKENSSFISISEFILKEPLLSFAINVAKERKSRSSSDEAEADLDDSEDKEEKEEKSNLSVVTLFAIQKRALQKLSIKFKASTSVHTVPPSISTASQDDLSIRDGLSDIEVIENTTDKNPPESLSLSDEDLSSSVASVHSLESTLTTVSTISLLPSSITPVENKLDVSSHNEDGETTLIDIQSTETNTSVMEEYSIVSESLIHGMEKLSFDVSMIVGNDAVANDAVVNGHSESSASAVMNGESQPDESMTSSVHSVRQRTLSFDALDGVVLDEKPVISTPNITSDKTTAPVDMQQMATILNKQQQLLSQQQLMLNSQQQELSEMKGMLKLLVNQKRPALGESQVAASDTTDHEDLKVFMQLLQKSALSQFSKASKDFNKSCTHRIDQFIQDLHAHVQSREDRTVQQLSSVVPDTIAIKLEKTIKGEMKQTVLNGLERIQREYFEKLTNQIAQKLSVWERTLREESQELIKSKPLAESIGFAAASILEGTIPNAYRESFKNVLLPGFEKASMTMFAQINDAFQKGTKQYLERLEGHLESRRQKQQEKQDPLINNLQDLVHSFQGTADRLTSGVETNLEALMQKQLRDATDRMQNNLGKSIEAQIIPLIAKSVNRHFGDAFNEWKTKIDESLSLIQSSTASASMLVDDRDPRTRVAEFLKLGDYNSAFDAALNASDLEVVMFLCKQVDPVELFQAKDKLPQPTILSLMQQFSMHLNEETETKIRYMEESIMALDPEDEITRQHMPAVLTNLTEQVNIAIECLTETDPSNKQIKRLKMLVMASKSLLHGD